jgi:ATP-dependent Zn protease
MSRRNLTAVAYHEAGHAVLLAAIGCKVHKITIMRYAGINGRVRAGTPLRGIRNKEIGSPATRLQAEGAIMISLAGALAQKRVLPRSWRSWHSSTDDAYATILAQRFCTSVPETKAFLKWLEIRTQQRLDAHWKTVELIANALLERKRLSGKEFDELIRPRRCRLFPNILQVDREQPTAHQ